MGTAGTKRKETSSAPLTTDQVLRLNNVVKNQSPPTALQTLKSPNSFTILDAPSDLRLEAIAHKVALKSGMSAWSIDNDKRVIRGLPVQKFVRQAHHPRDVESPTLPLPPPEPPFCPEWSDRIYYPKVSPRIFRPTMRRKGGKRLHPHGYIWGTDVRQPFFPSGYPWQCIGKVAIHNPYTGAAISWGTGALVGPNTVLTASHVIPWGPDPTLILFIPGYFNGQSVIGPGVSSYVSAESTYDTNNPPAPAFDFAVLQLEDRLGDSLGWLGTKTYDDGWNDQSYWTLVGYPGLVAGGEQPSLQFGINFHDDDEDSNDFGDAMELETQNGDSTSGDSGGPYFAFWDDGPYIVGVDVGGESEFSFNVMASFEDDNNVASAGQALVQLVSWARSTWE